MNSILSVQNEDFTGNGEEFTKVYRPIKQAKSYLQNWSLANLVKMYHGIIELQHIIDPRQMALLKEPCEE